jgi:uncharacterized heparinase superfamily protein
MNLPRLIRTLAPLRPIQIYGRARFRLTRPAADLSPAPPRRAPRGWRAPAPRVDSLIAPDRVRLLNHEADISAPSAWNDPAQAKLWLYNLHYFDWLGAECDAERTKWRRALVARWIAQNPPGHGNGWEPYPLSLRIVNWIKWALAGAPMAPEWLDSLAAQARWLARRLEWHLLGNHLFANAKALVFAGLFFEGAEADAWLAAGLDILAREVDEQILADGGHFELSPMYHAIIFEDLLDLINLAEATGGAGGSPVGRWRTTAGRMARWLAVMTHPDGEIAFFNDAAIGVAPSPAALGAYAARLGVAPLAAPGEGIVHLAESGYVRLARGDAVALLDIGRIGPDYLPGHAHADTLSFELSIAGRRAIVNGGTSAYAGPIRARERATAAHSTVEVAGLDSSEMWGAFRVGRRARVFDVAIHDGADGLEVSAAHDGYRFLAGRPIHRRRWRLEDGLLEVRDEVAGGSRRALARFHLAPGFVAESADGDRQFDVRNGALSLRIETSRPAGLVDSRWARGFGDVRASRSIVAEAPLATRLTWPPS